MKRATRPDEGFTLIELLVVIVVIGILAAIAIPTFLAQRDEGYDAQAAADARQLLLLVEDARDDAGAYPAVLPTYKKSVTTAPAVYHGSATSYCVSVASKVGHVFRVTSQDGKVVEVPAACTSAAG